MKLLCDAVLFYKSIGNTPDREKFTQKYGNPEKFQSGIFVELGDGKTLTQLGTVWRDWGIAGKLLGMSANAVYLKLMKCKEIVDCWFKKDDKGNWEFFTLSQLNKEDIGRLIDRYRPVIQNWVDEAHGEHIEINWSCKENKEAGKPDFEQLEGRLEKTGII